MATYTVQQIDLDGETTDLVAVASSDQFPNNGKTYLHVKNTNAATRTITVNSTTNCDQGFDHDVAVVIAATTGDVKIGPFPTARFGTTVTVSYTATANVTAGAFSL